jgi:hypothetical protein
VIVADRNAYTAKSAQWGNGAGGGNRTLVMAPFEQGLLVKLFFDPTPSDEQ